MPKSTWILTDVDQDLYVESIALSPRNVGGAATGYFLGKRTLRGGLRDGVDVIEVDNGTFRCVLVPTRGMGMWHATQGGISLGWRSPVKGPVHPAFVRINEPSGIGWLDGFDELLCRCGLESNGAPEFHANGTLRYPLHGKIANRPAHRVEAAIDGDSGEISVTGTVDEARLFGNKMRMVSRYTTRVGQPGITVTDTITNLSAAPGDLELLYHTNFGRPFVVPGSKVALPFSRLAPRDQTAVGNVDQWDTYGPEQPELGEAVFFIQPVGDARGQSRAVLRNPASDQGLSYHFNINQLPYFTLWKNRQAEIDGYVTGLEPGINFPNRKSFEKEHGRVAVLAPGESRTFELTLEVHPSAESVAIALDAVRKLQQNAAPEVLRQPHPDWS
ncbi:MAG: aldose 1-epimerase family protein [Pirellulales bacterium]|nr:aldose 1-epimerase family protein [Pirellulales bacterium]